jgi:hypothetical protein
VAKVAAVVAVAAISSWPACFNEMNMENPSITKGFFVFSLFPRLLLVPQIVSSVPHLRFATLTRSQLNKASPPHAAGWDFEDSNRGYFFIEALVSRTRMASSRETSIGGLGTP